MEIVFLFSHGIRVSENLVETQITSAIGGRYVQFVPLGGAARQSDVFHFYSSFWYSKMLLSLETGAPISIYSFRKLSSFSSSNFVFSCPYSFSSSCADYALEICNVIFVFVN